MTTDNHPAKVLNGTSSGSFHKWWRSSSFLHSSRYINNFIANIFSKAFLSMFADFYSPLKHSSLHG